MATPGLAGPFIDAFSRIFVIESGLISIATTFFCCLMWQKETDQG
jgi:hypothetical protein